MQSADSDGNKSNRPHDSNVADRQRAVQQILAECWQRLTVGEPFDASAVLAAHPLLLPELTEGLQHLRLVQLAQTASDHTESQRESSSPLTIRCPHCHSPMPVDVEVSLSSFHCSSCGNDFSLLNDEAEQISPGDRLAHFELRRVLGAGGFGVVYLAHDTELDRLVALKVPRHGGLSAEEGEQFLREARAAAQLRHANIVGVYEVGRDDRRIYIASEYIAGASLAETLTAQNMTAGEAATCCEKLARALHHAHSAGIVHRDLKPGNVIMDADGEPHITDFGLARRDQGEVSVTKEGVVVGTPAYMSPEQARGESHQVDGRSDVYSLGVILFELLTGGLPFRGNAPTVTQQIVHDEATSPRKLNSTVPRDLETICLKCLEKEPRRRYETAEALADDLNRFLRGEPIVARPVGRLERSWRWCNRKPALATLLLLLVLAAVGAPFVAFQQHASRRAAQLQARASRWQQYLSDMHSAADALADANVGRVMNLLTRHRPEPGAEDWRGFEWFYLWRQCQRGLSQRTLQHGSVLYSVAISPDGSTLAAGGVSSFIQLWDLATGNKLREFPEARGWVHSVAFAPNGKTLASRDNYAIKVWDIASGALLFETADDSFENYALAFSRDGRILAAVTDQHKVIQLWDTTTYQVLLNIDVGKAPSYYLSFSPDGNLLASSDSDGNVTLLNPLTGESRFALLGDCGYATPICFTLDNKALVSGGPAGAIVVWDLASRVPRRTLVGHASTISSLALSDDGRLLASASADGIVKVWDTERFGEHDTLLESSGRVSVAFQNDGRTLAAGGRDGVVRLWDLSAPSARDILKGNVAGVWCVAVSPQGELLACGGMDGTVKLWDIASGRELRSLAAHTGAAWCVAFDMSGKVLASGGNDHSICLWDAATGKQKATLKGHAHWVRRIIFAPDGKTLVSGGDDGQARVWDLESQRTRRVFYPKTECATALAVSLDGRVVAVGGTEHHIEVWDLSSGQLLRTLAGHRDEVESVAFSPNGRTLASGSHDRTVKLWDWAAEGELHTLVGHTDYVYSVAFSPDGRTLASASHDGTVRLWDVATLDERVALRGHSGKVYWVAFTPDGRTVVSCGEDDTIRLWRAATQSDVRAATTLSK